MARLELRALSGASAVKEQDCLDSHRAIQDVQDGDSVSADAVEDQVSAMNPATDTVMFISGHHGPGLRHVGNVESEMVELAHKAHRPQRVVSGDVVADGFKVRLCFGGDLGLHSVG